MRAIVHTEYGPADFFSLKGWKTLKRSKTVQKGLRNEDKRTGR
jgi:hypothetical protein